MLAKTGTWDRLFAKFTECLDTLGLIVTEGKIIDASFVIAPRQRTGREEDKWTKENKEVARAGRYDKTDLARNAARTWMPDGGRNAAIPISDTRPMWWYAGRPSP